MPITTIQNVELSKISVNLIYFIGILISLFGIIGIIISSYLFFVMNTFTEKFIDMKKLSEEESKKNDKMHEDHYSRIHDNETILQVTKTTLDNHVRDCKDKHRND